MIIWIRRLVMWSPNFHVQNIDEILHMHGIIHLALATIVFEHFNAPHTKYHKYLFGKQIMFREKKQTSYHLSIFNFVYALHTYTHTQTHTAYLPF